MKRISTLLTASIAIALTASFQVAAQCSFSTTAPATAPGVTNTFNTNSEGFSGNISHSGGALLTSSGSGVRTITSPIFYLSPSQDEIVLRFTLERTASHDITAYSVTANTNTTTYTLCPTTTLSPSLSPISPTVYYLVIPRGSLPVSTNFQLNLNLTQTGSFRFDNFGTNVASASGSLPVNFVGFEGRKEGNGIKLTWKVDVEEHAKGYEIERSSDGKNFTSIGFVAAAGQSTYSFVDVKAQPLAYYRIKGLDLDGKYRFSPVVTMKNGAATIMMKVFPLPANKSITIQHPSATANTNIALYTESGVMVKSVKAGYNAQQTVIDLSNVKPGLYLLRFDNGDGSSETMKIIKQ